MTSDILIYSVDCQCWLHCGLVGWCTCSAHACGVISYIAPLMGVLVIILSLWCFDTPCLMGVWLCPAGRWFDKSLSLSRSLACFDWLLDFGGGECDVNMVKLIKLILSSVMGLLHLRFVPDWQMFWLGLTCFTKKASQRWIFTIILIIHYYLFYVFSMDFYYPLWNYSWEKKRVNERCSLQCC